MRVRCATPMAEATSSTGVSDTSMALVTAVAMF